MKLLSVMFLTVICLSPTAKWLTSFSDAKREAAQHNKAILLSFSGSDWCTPCIRLKKEMFESSAFDGYANDNLILVNADFPRLKKNQLPLKQRNQNDSLAAVYNPEGEFPLTILFDAKGKIIKKWNGIPNLSPEAFVTEIKAAANASH